MNIDDEQQKFDKHDHRRLGSELKLFHFSDYAPGMPFWLPNGARLRKRLENIIYNAHTRRGYEPVLTPKLLDVDLWKVSGHYDNYSENMFFSEVEKRENALAPMNCPGHVINYKSDVRSHNHLPLRFFEFGQVHRNENSGSLYGLFRVRTFQQDDLHSFCRPDQVKDEIIEHLNFIHSMLTAFNFEYIINLSTRPEEKTIGSDENWEKAESSIKEALEEIGQKYEIDEGHAAFYGPKIDVKVKDNHGREFQLSTIQVDFNLPERFDMNYVDENNNKCRPVMIHRAILGSFERFIGMVLEHFNGLLPVAISPFQAAIVPIAPADPVIMEYANEIKQKMSDDLGADVRIYDDTNSLNKRIRIAERAMNPIIVVVGGREVENRTVNIRHKIKKERMDMSLEDFFSMIKEDMTLTI